MKKKIIIIFVIIFILLLVPIPLKLKDGGSIEYKAILYNVTKIHRINNQSLTGYEDGWKIEILGIPIYNEVDVYIDTDKTENYELISELNSCVNCYNYLYEFEDGTKVYSSCKMIYKTVDVEISLSEAIDKRLITLSDLEKNGSFKIVKENEECLTCCG